MTATVHEPTARHSKRRRPGSSAGLIVFLVLALVAAGAGFLVRAQAEPPAATPTPGTGAAVAPAAYLLSAEATAEVRAARFRISTTRSPASVVLALDPAGKSPARTVPVDLSAASTEVVVRGLAVGMASWTITAAGPPTLRGHLRIPATAPAATPDPGSATQPPATREPRTTTAPGPRSAPAAPSRPAPTTQAPKPAPLEPSSPPPTPRPTGPASPYDPDDD